MLLVIISLIPTTITSIWVLPIAIISNIKSVRRLSALGPHLRTTTHSRDGAWYWPILWAITMAQFVAVLINAMPLVGAVLGVMFRSEVYRWFLHSEGNWYDEGIVLYNHITLSHHDGNIWFMTAIFGTLLGIKTATLGSRISWRLWHGQDVVTGN